MNINSYKEYISVKTIHFISIRYPKIIHFGEIVSFVVNGYSSLQRIMRGYKKPTVSIIGASGYSGAELTKILLGHPSVKLERLYAHTQADRKIQDIYPALDTDLVLDSYSGEKDTDIYFLALPHGEALTLVPQLADAGKLVIDLSGDFRLKNPEEHSKYYQKDKSPESVLTYAMPELYHDEIRQAKAVSNPGCYATSIILGVAPLIKKPLKGAAVKSINCTAISGISGAGRSGKVELSFSEMSGNIRAYKVGIHQHTPEILQALDTDTVKPAFAFTFTPMIAPLVRGIYTVLNIQLEKHLSVSQIREHFSEFYRSAPFVRIRQTMTEVQHVAYTNFCDVHIAESAGNGSAVIVTAIDNLVKGAAGQAVQNMNIMLGYNETHGLL